VSAHGASIVRTDNGKITDWADYYDGLTSRRTPWLRISRNGLDSERWSVPQSPRKRKHSLRRNRKNARDEEGRSRSEGCYDERSSLIEFSVDRRNWNPNVAIAQGTPPPSRHAVTVVKTGDGSSYTGLTSAFIDGKPYLYAANFTKGRVDVYDSAFHRLGLSSDDPDFLAPSHCGRVTRSGYIYGDCSDDHTYFSENSFVDGRLPRPYAPFNVQAIGNDIVVTYAIHQQGVSPLETDGPGLGFVDIYSSTGHLLLRLEHGDWLNAPWGVAVAPADFGRFSHNLLIGQFAGGGDTQSSGYIAAYDLTTGKFNGLLPGCKRKASGHQRYLGAQPWECQP